MQSAPETKIRRRALAALVAALTMGGLLWAAPAAAGAAPGFDGACEGELIELHNDARVDAGLAPLREDPAFDQVSRAWAIELSRSMALRHNPSYVAQIGRVVTNWERMGENVGYGPSGSALHTAYMNSPGHRANIMNPQFQRIAVGCFRDVYGRAWTAVNFVRASTAVPSRSFSPFSSAGETVGQLRTWMLGGQPPSSGTVEVETDVLLRGAKSVPVYAADLASSAAHSDTVPAATRMYYAVFLRHPDAPGLDFWINERQRGLSLHTIANRFVASREFQERYGNLGDEEFVDRVYQNVLGRPADAPGRHFWVTELRKGMMRGRVITGFSESREYKAKMASDVTVSWAFIQLLGRPATASERETWTPMLKDGTMTSRDLVASLVRSSGMSDRVAENR